MKNKSLNKYFQGLTLFNKNKLTVEQFLFLLNDSVDAMDSSSSMCFACSLIFVEEKGGAFISQSPKFDLNDLKKIWQWLAEKKVTGSIDPYVPCNDTRKLIAELAINEEVQRNFLAWLPNHYG